MDSKTFDRVSKRRGSVTQHVDVIDPGLALDLATAQSYTENVFLFVPNLIGYARALLTAASLYYMSTSPKYSTLMYGLSALLDAADGHAARALGQTSKFGAVLDMVVDRCATSCLLCYLTLAYPEYALMFQFLIALDFSSHYMHMYSSLITGSKSHKAVENDVSRILKLYYNPTYLFAICFGNELFFVALYLMKWVDTPLDYKLAQEHPILMDLTWASAIALVCLPVCVLKNIINLVQLWKASKILVGVDLVERGMARRALEAKEFAASAAANSTALSEKPAMKAI